MLGKAFKMSILLAVWKGRTTEAFIELKESSFPNSLKRTRPQLQLLYIHGFIQFFRSLIGIGF